MGRQNRKAVYDTMLGGERLQIGTVLDRLKHAQHPLGRSAVKDHLRVLIAEGKVDSSGIGRYVWYWRKEEESD